MLSTHQKDKFFQVIENIFIGAKIEGDSGYVRLMRTKSLYYREVREKIKAEITDRLHKVGWHFEEELYNKLYTFFKKYFSDSGSIYFTYTPLHEKVYERIYRDDQDVMLFWKTHMLYYVKTERLYKELEVEEDRVRYLFDVSKLQHKQSNERRDLVFTFHKAAQKEYETTIIFHVQYAEKGRKTNIEALLKQIKKQGKKYFDHLTEKQIERACNIFKRQSEVDYFINKNAKQFLREQFSLWIKSYLIDDETLFEEERLKQLKALQEIAFKIIDLVSQLEDELVKIWNKPKYAHSSHYVITLDRIAQHNFHLLQKILEHTGISNQVKEWEALGMVDTPFDIHTILQHNKLNPHYQYLPLDTQYIKDLELDILALFDNLDHQLDGWLIHSENYQALNTLKNKFKEKVQTVYIDPPFNLESSDQFDYRTNYKDASWLSLLENRLKVTQELMSDSSGIFTRCDYNGNFIVRPLLSSLFGHQNYRNEIIISKSAKITEKLKKYHNDHDSLYFFTKTENYLFDCTTTTRKEVKWQPMHLPGVRWSPVDKEIALKLSKENVREENGTFKTIARLIFGKEYLPPQGRHWALSQKAIFEREKEGKIRINHKGNPESIQSSQKRLTDNWTDIPGYASSQNFSTENSEKLLARVIQTSSHSQDIVLDYFMGSATTQAVAHKLGRKWIGVEMGKHFHTVCLPRMKKVLFGVSSGISKEVGFAGGGFFKYYALEQYESVLTKVRYEEQNTLPTKDIYHQYIFLKDLKLTDKTLHIDAQEKRIKVNLTKLHPHIDIPETLSHLTGKFIKQIKKDQLIFTDGTTLDLTNLDYKIVKPLIWW